MASELNQADTVTPLLPHYVYVLADPADRSVIYVGKGQGKRVSHHWAEAQRYVGTETAKLSRLRELKQREVFPLELIIGRYETEEEAFAVEATLIKWVYGFDNLTNAVHGHGHDSIRSLGNWEATAQLDMERRVGVRDLQFTNKNTAGLMGAGAYDYLNDLAAALKSAGFAVRDFSDAPDRPYHPGESNGWLGLLVRIQNVDFIVYFSKAKQPKIKIATTLSSRAARPLLVRHSWVLAEPNNLKAGPSGKKEGRYQTIMSRPSDVVEGVAKAGWSFEAEAIEQVVQTFLAIRQSIVFSNSK
jgi:hypothetical protein